MKKTMKTTIGAAIAAAVINTPQSVDAALLAHWTFDEGAGTAVADSSGNGNDAWLSETVGSQAWVTNGSAPSGNAYTTPRFSLDQGVQTPNVTTPAQGPDSKSLNFAGGSVTLSLWITDPNGGATWQGIAGFEGTGSAGDIYGFKLDTGKLAWTSIGGSSQTSTDTLANYATASGANNGWVHLVGVYDGVTGTSYIYINGVLDATGIIGGAIPDKTTTGPATFNIGRYYDTLSYDFSGSIDDVQVYNEALDATDAAFLFNNAGSVVAVPEPSSMALLGLGGLALILRRRK